MSIKTPPTKISSGYALSMLDRALKEEICDRSFTKKDIDEVRKYFENKGLPGCVYCGSSDLKRWDHLVPASGGGDTVKGNLVPSCSSCDDSKQNKNYKTWMVSDADKSPKSKGVIDISNRITAIDGYVAHYGYSAKPVTERLTKPLAKEYKVLLDEIQLLKEKVDAFKKKTKT